MTDKALVPTEQWDRDSGWVVVRAKGKAVHVIPFSDTRAHECSTQCWCRPVLDEEDNVVAHNSADGREHIERGGKLQ